MTTKQLIKEYVDDHFKHFGFYPYDVEIDGQVYSYGGYWEILEDDRFDLRIIKEREFLFNSNNTGWAGGYLYLR